MFTVEFLPTVVNIDYISRSLTEEPAQIVIEIRQTGKVMLPPQRQSARSVEIRRLEVGGGQMPWLGDDA